MKLNKVFIGLILTIIINLNLNAEKIDANFRNLTISDFVKMVAKITETNILISGNLKGKVNFISHKKIDRDQFIPLTNAILETKGMTMVNKGDYYQVIKSNIASGTGLNISREVSKKDGSMSTVIFQLKNANASTIKNKVKTLLHRSAKSIAFKKNNLLVITAYPETLKSVKKLIDAVEKKEDKVTLTVYLKNIQVKDIFPSVKNMVKSFFSQDVENEKVISMQNLNDNSIILIGRRKNLKIIKKYIKNLDIKSRSSLEYTIHIVPLKYSNAEDIEKILSKVLPALTNNSASAKKAIITSDLDKNALIILANRDQFINIKNSIRELDIPKAQVYIQVKIIEINLNLAEQVGVKYGFNGGKITSKGLFTLGANTGSPALNISENLLNFLNTSETNTTSNITTTKKAFEFDAGIKEVFSLGVSLDLLKVNGAAKIMSNPSILATNNKESSIYIGRVQSILTQSQQSTQGNANVLNNFSREDIGLTLKVKPRFTGKNKVYLDIEAEIEDILLGSGSTADKPTTTKRMVKTHVIANHAETIILGGLIKKGEGKSNSGIPILGEIPLLGKLFKSSGVSESKVNVVIYLTPYIVRTTSDLKDLRKNLNELEDIQEQYNKSIRKLLDKKIKKKGHVTFSSKSRDFYPGN